MTDKPQIIITRPEPDGTAFAELAKQHGFDPILSPAMDIERLDASPDLEDVAALAFTSANGVRAFAAKSTDRSAPVFAVGAATADAANAAGFKKVSAGTGDLASLVALIKASKPLGAVLHIAGRDRAGDLVAALKNEGVSAKRSVLYKATPRKTLSDAAHEAIANDAQPLWVALFSPRTADIALNHLSKAGLDHKQHHLKAACLSDAVAERLGEKVFAEIHIAGERTSTALIDLIVRRTN